MTNPDFRALCAELANAYQHELNRRGLGCDLIQRARAALAQPEPPSLKEEALKALERMQDQYPHLGNTKTIRRALEALPND
jgi:hypothetical protein